MKMHNTLMSVEDAAKHNDQHEPEELHHKILSFKDSRGFKYVKDIKTKYTIGKILGQGSFGTVRLA